MLGVGANGPDEARVPVLLQRKDGHELARVQRGVQLSVHRRAASFDVGDVEQMFISAAGESDRERLPHRGMRAVAAGDVGGLAHLDRAVRALQSSEHPTGSLLERQELGLALDFDAGLAQAIDQQALMLVLRKDQHVGKWTDPHTHVADYGVGDLFPGCPEVDRRHLPPALDDGVSEADLPIQLERPCLDCKGARCRSRPVRLVDDPHADAHHRQPESQDEARRSCADDDDVSVTNR